MSEHQPPVLEYRNPRTSRRVVPATSPHPIASFIVGMAIVSVPLVIVAALIVAGHRGQIPDSRAQCASNLRQIGQAIRLYANNHGGAYPPNLAALYINEDLDPGRFVCPACTDKNAGSPTTQGIYPTTQEITTRLAERANTRYVSYDYQGARLTQSTVKPNMVIAHEQIGNHPGPGINVLYGDGRVDWLEAIEGGRLLYELRHGHNPPRP